MRVLVIKLCSGCASWVNWFFVGTFPRNSPVNHVGVYHSCKLHFLQTHKMACIWHTSISKLHHFLFLYYIVLKQSLFLLLVILVFWHHSEGIPFVCLLLSECLRIFLEMSPHLRGGSVGMVESGVAYDEYNSLRPGVHFTDMDWL